MSPCPPGPARSCSRSGRARLAFVAASPEVGRIHCGRPAVTGFRPWRLGAAALEGRFGGVPDSGPWECDLATRLAPATVPVKYAPVANRFSLS